MVKLDILEDKFQNTRRRAAAGHKGRGVSTGDGEAEHKIAEDAAGGTQCSFQEVFGGGGGLTDAVRRCGLSAFHAMDLDNGDLLDRDVFKELLKKARLGQIRWLHGAPPCRFL